MRDYVIDTRFAPDGTSGLFNFGVIVKSHLLNPKQVTVYYDLYGPDSTLVAPGKRDARFEMRLEDYRTLFRKHPEHRIVEPRKPETLHHCATHPA
ncbi:MAG: hypothetical protein ACLR8Y_13985 [Alistipes indistinctus]